MRSTFRVLFYLKREKQKANGHTPTTGLQSTGKKPN